MMSVVSAAQPEAIIPKYFSAVRRGEHPIMPALAHASNADRYIDSVAPFLRDSVPLVRAKACEIVHAVASSSLNTEVRTRATAMLVGAARDSIIENAGLALDLLTSFTKPDFSKAALDTFRSCIIQGSPFMDRAMKLAGFLELDDLAPQIRSLAQPGHPTFVRWAALLALARLGDESAIAEVGRRVKKIPLSDRVVYDLFPDLIYTRRRELIAIAVDALLHDESSCLSPNPEKEVPIPCGYRIMELLAPVIEDYPLVLDETGDVNVDDYPAALEQARQFFLTKKDYQINTDHY